MKRGDEAFHHLVPALAFGIDSPGPGSEGK